MNPTTAAGNAERARFEAWANEQGFLVTRSPSGNYYVDADTQRTWDSWQAALSPGNATPAGETKATQGLREALDVGKPTRAGYYWFTGTYLSRGKWSLVEVFRPFWVDPTRQDLRWRYLDRSGGEESDSDVATCAGQWSAQVIPPGSLITAQPAPSRAREEGVSALWARIMDNMESHGTEIEIRIDAEEEISRFVTSLSNDLTTARQQLAEARAEGERLKAAPIITEVICGPDRSFELSKNGTIADLRQQVSRLTTELEKTKQALGTTRISESIQPTTGAKSYYQRNPDGTISPATVKTESGINWEEQLVILRKEGAVFLDSDVAELKSLADQSERDLATLRTLASDLAAALERARHRLNPSRDYQTMAACDTALARFRSATPAPAGT